MSKWRYLADRLLQLGQIIMSDSERYEKEAHLKFSSQVGQKWEPNKQVECEYLSSSS